MDSTIIDWLKTETPDDFSDNFPTLYKRAKNCSMEAGALSGQTVSNRLTAK